AADWKTRYEAAIVASGQVLYELDPASGTLYWTGDAERLGFALQNVSTLAAYLERVHPHHRESVRSAFVALARGQRRDARTTHRRLAAPGEEQRIEGDANATVDFDDSVHRIVGFFRPDHASGEDVAEASPR